MDDTTSCAPSLSTKRSRGEPLQQTPPPSPRGPHGESASVLPRQCSKQPTAELQTSRRGAAAPHGPTYHRLRPLRIARTRRGVASSCHRYGPPPLRVRAPPKLWTEGSRDHHRCGSPPTRGGVGVMARPTEVHRDTRGYLPAWPQPHRLPPRQCSMRRALCMAAVGSEEAPA